MNIVIENFENNTSTAAKQYMSGGGHVMKAGDFTQSKELFNHALAIMEDTPENYIYPMHTIYLDMALMAILQNDDQAYLEYSQKMHATGFQPKAGNSQNLMVWMDAIWAIKQGQGDRKNLIESLTIQLTREDGIPEYNQLYLILAQATLSFYQKDYQQAQHFNELALAYWEKLPRHYLHFKYYAEQLDKKIKNS
ncbi:MAG: hypothetical protein KDI92_15525 [Xanthomonadales bacterium]|nr:hypothetical protein [Xanthomonadales bacterium]